jgi:hypothetical protein
VGGRISLGDSSVQGLGTLTAAKTDSPSQPTEVPFLLGGTFDDILILPDFGRMTKRNAAELKDTGVPIDTPPVETAPHG